MPIAEKNEAQLFVKKHPDIIKNSPIKLLVPGNPMLAMENSKKKVENNGIVVSKPAKYLIILV